MGRGTRTQTGVVVNGGALRNSPTPDYRIPALARLPSKYPIFTSELTQEAMERVRAASEGCIWCGEPLDWSCSLKSPALPLSNLLPKPYDGQGLLSTCARCAHKYARRSLQSVIDGLQTILYNQEALVAAWLYIESIQKSAYPLICPR